MRLLDRYIGRAVFMNTLLVVFILWALYSALAFFTELEDVGKQQYGLLDAGFYVLLTSPQRIFELLPLATLIGTVIGLGGLANSSELVAVRAAGVSLWRIFLAVVKVGLVMIALSLLVGEWLGPLAEQTATNRKAQALSTRYMPQSHWGFWSRDGDTFVHVRTILPGPRLRGVTLFELDAEQGLRRMAVAREAIREGEGWRLRGVRASEISPQRIETQRLRAQAWETQLSIDVLETMVVQPRQLSIRQLQEYIAHLLANKQESRVYEMAMWMKIASPFATLAMLLLAMPFVFGSLRSVAVSQRVLLGTLVGIGFYVLNQMSGQLGRVVDLPAPMSAFLPVLVMVAIALWRLRRVQ